MLFSKKPALYFEFLDSRIRYLVMDSQTQDILEKAEILFETEIIKDGKIVNADFIKKRLKVLIAEKKWKKAKVSILLPDDSVVIREEIIPGQLNEAEVKDYLTLHIGQSIRSPFNATSFHAEIIWKNDQDQKVCIMMYPATVIEAFQDILTEVDLIPQVADISALCLYRLLEEDVIKQGDEGHRILVLQWSPLKSTMMVFNQNLPTFSRSSRNPGLASEWERNEQGEWLWLEESEKLQQEIQNTLEVLERFLEFYRYSVLNGKGGVTEIILAGDFSYLGEMKAKMEQRFYLPIRTIDAPRAIESKYLPLWGLTRKPKAAKRRNDKGKKEDFASV